MYGGKLVQLWSEKLSSCAIDEAEAEIDGQAEAQDKSHRELFALPAGPMRGEVFEAREFGQPMRAKGPQQCSGQKRYKHANITCWHKRGCCGDEFCIARPHRAGRIQNDTGKQDDNEMRQAPQVYVQGQGDEPNNQEHDKERDHRLVCDAHLAQIGKGDIKAKRQCAWKKPHCRPLCQFHGASAVRDVFFKRTQGTHGGLEMLRMRFDCIPQQAFAGFDIALLDGR